MSMHTIDQAKNMRNGINLEGEVVRKGETRTVSKKTGGTIDVCDAYLKDSANEEIKITLWAEDIEKISQGAKIKITNGYTSSFKGDPQNLDRQGQIRRNPSPSMRITYIQYFSF